jgi:CRP-like cAMP-binding protein
VSRFDATAEAGARLPLFDVGVTIPTRKTERGARAIAEVCGRIDYIQPGESSLLARKIAGGAVAVLRDGVEIAAVTEPGAVFGELSVLLDQPHAADVRALEASQFYIVDAATLRVDPIAVLYIATVLARRLDDADQALVALRRELQAGEPRGAIEKAAETMEGLLGAGGAGPEHARYPYDLFAPDPSSG